MYNIKRPTVLALQEQTSCLDIFVSVIVICRADCSVRTYRRTCKKGFVAAGIEFFIWARVHESFKKIKVLTGVFNSRDLVIFKQRLHFLK